MSFHGTGRSSVAPVAAVCFAGALLFGVAWSATVSPGSPTPRWDATLFMAGGTYDPSVPTPESVLGFPMGTRPVRYEEMWRYLATLDTASPRVAVLPYAKSHEGRALIYVAIGTESRLANLEAVQEAAAKWADPRASLPAEPPADLPLVAWLGYAIHGDELSSTDAALQLVYQLAAGTDSVTQRIRDRVLVCIDPSQNPDGRERFLAQMQAFAGRVPNPDDQSLQHQGFWPWGRVNHYLFDLNRDWIYVVNPESQGRVRAVTGWKPQLVVDSHEMGWDDTYLFSPAREPFNPHLPALMRPWAHVFSRDQAAAFDRRGWSYYTREWNEEFFPGYGSSWAAYHGAVGILYEQAGTDGSLVRQPDGNVLTFRDAVAHQFTSSITNLDTAARNRAVLLRDARLSRRAALDAGSRGPVRVFAYSGADSGRAAHLTERAAPAGCGSPPLPRAADPGECPRLLGRQLRAQEAAGRQLRGATRPAAGRVGAQPARIPRRDARQLPPRGAHVARARQGHTPVRGHRVVAAARATGSTATGPAGRPRAISSP